MDLDEERAQPAHGVTRSRRRLLQRLPCNGRAFRLRGGAQRVGDPRQVLHRPVVELGRDPPAFVVGCLDRADEQRLALGLRAPKSPVEAPGERHLNEPEEDEAAEQERCERHPDAAPGGRDRAPPLVRLEQERRPARGADREVHLVQVALPALVPVLGSREIAQRRLRGARLQHVELLRVEGKPHADQARLVRVHDPTIGRPQLDPDDPLAEHALLDDPIDGGDRLRLAVQKPRRDCRLDDPLARKRGELPRVAKRLAVPQTAQREERRGAEHREHGEPGEGELRDGVPHRACAGSTTKVPSVAGTCLAASSEASNGRDTEETSRWVPGRYESW